MIRDEIDSILFDKFKENNFVINFKLNKEDPFWENYLKNLNYIYDDYSSYVIEYRNLYLIENSALELEDLSIIIFHENKPIALWPLTITKKNNKYQLSSQNLPILEPLMDIKISNKIKKKIINSCLEIISDIKAKLKISKVLINDKINHKNYISLWHEKNLLISKAVYSDYLMYMDLTQTIKDIKNQIRSSYKSLISLANKQYEIKTISNVSESNFSEYIDFHRLISGKMTRSQSTWLFQSQNINSQKSFIVEARKNSELLGYGLFRHTRDEGFYEVGVYNRDEIYNNLSHGINFAAINEFKNRGCKWYYIGNLNFISKYSNPNQKEINISFFEQGFSSHIFHHNTFLL